MSKKHGREHDSVVVDAPKEKSEVAVREEAIQQFWVEHDIFNKSLERPAGNEPVGEYVFYDGPPFATGLPHYGHLLAGTIKDAVPRFWTMRGYRVRRKWGWDCHGLPLENLIEKELGLASKRDIEEFGIQNFNEKARSAVMRYADEWRQIIPRFGRFVDMDDDYKTMDSTYTESVWWVFKTLYEKGLVFEGFKSMHLCPRCGTTLSNFEVNQGYKDIKDISVYVKLHLHAGQAYGPEYKTKDTAHLLVWTTTPWTLPGNMAAAVNAEVAYAAVRVDGELLIVAKDNVESVFTGVEYELVHDDIKGSDLVGLTYEPPFAHFKDKNIDQKANAWQVYAAEYVEVGAEGTGAVHLAPAYGEEDMELAKEHGIPIVHHVDYEGRFMDFVTDFAGQKVKPKDDDNAGVTHLDADIEIVKALKANGRLFKKENITHSYPHCWRDDTPLLNYATTSWFVDVPKIRNELVAANQQVHWVPEHIGKNRFGKWLEGARDWAVSRQRYWGAPLPIWKNPTTGEYKIFGSLSELKEFTPKKNNRYFLMRHGESYSNATDTTNSDPHTDEGLTDAGLQAVHAAAKNLQSLGITKIVHSPFPRTTETARCVAQTLGLPESSCLVEERISEISMGNLEGRPNKEYQDLFTECIHWCDVKPEGGESWQDVKRRVGAVLYELEEANQNETILFVSHNSPLRMLAAVAHGHRLHDSEFDHDTDGARFKNAEVREVDFLPIPHNDDYELDFHRPYIDAVTLVDTDGTTLERVPDVFDCWFESGAMPYAETHYPFANLEVADPKQEIRFPANFIAESVDQTRGWFYSLLVLGVALFGKSPYRNVITNGLVLAEDGKKMSKSLQNYPDPVELVDRVGADAVRYYLLSSSIIRGEDLNFSEKEVTEQMRKNIGRLHNVLAMYELYADGTPANADSIHVLDRWILARLNELIAETTTGYENYELDKATRPLTDFIDDISVWYLRRSRDRFKADNVSDKTCALATLRYVLRELAKLMAPAMPFYAEYLYRAVREDSELESVHLTAWPKKKKVDRVVLDEMDIAREYVSLALDARTKSGIKVRQPLLQLTTATELTSEYASIVADEVNVKEVVYAEGQAERMILDTTLTPELLVEGDARELIRSLQNARKQAGLQPKDRIKLTLASTSAGIALVEQFSDIICRTAGADTIDLVDSVDGFEIKAGEHIFTVALAVVA